MKIWKQLKQCYYNFFQCPNEDNFDEDFQKVLQTFYFFGFYRPKNIKERVFYGAFMFTVLLLTCIFGNLNYLVKTFIADEPNTIAFSSGFLLVLSLLSYLASFATQIILFACNQDRVIQMINEFHLMHEASDQGIIDDRKRKCLLMIRLYNLFLVVGGTTWVVFKVLGLSPYKLLMPAIYDELAVGYFSYGLLLLTNLIHLFCIIQIMVSCDLLHVICIIRAEANLKILCDKLRCCTNDTDLNKNERNLIGCMRYHCAIIT